MVNVEYLLVMHIRKILLFAILYLGYTVYITAQDAIHSSAMPVVSTDAKLPEDEYFFSTPREPGSKSFVASLLRSTSVKAAYFSNRGKKLTKKNGIVVGYNGNGDTQFIGYYQRNKLYGEWRSRYDNRQRCDSGRIVNDVPDGLWKGWYPDGKLRFAYHFGAAKLATLKDEICRQPKVKFFSIARQPAGIAVNYFDANSLFGNTGDKHQSLFARRKLYKKNYDELTLKSRIDQNTRTSSANEYFPPFVECLLHGSYTSYFPDGRTKDAGLYINGIREGLWEEFSEKENLRAVGTYHNGLRKGEWRYYDALGKLQELKIFGAWGKEKENFGFSSQ